MRKSPIFGLVVLLVALALISACGSPDRVAAPGDEGRLAEAVGINASAWTNRAPMPTPRSHFAIATFKNTAGRTIIYVIGGLTNGNATAVVEAYDPVANTWVRKAPMPSPRFQTNGATVIGGKIYVVGGWRDRHDISPWGGFFEYTPATNKWRTLDHGPFAVGGGCCGSGASGVIGGKLYVYQANDGAESQQLNRYDPVTRRWEYLTPSNFPHDGASAVVIRDKFYLFGWSDMLEIYDPALDSWTTGSPMFTGRDLGSTVLKGKLYVFGGTDTNSFVTRDVKIYDPASDAWSHGIPMTSDRSGMGAATVNASGQGSRLCDRRNPYCVLADLS